MELYLCEKPSQAQDLGKVLGVRKRGEGHLHDDNQRVITWAFGHLLELAMPDDYDPALKSWSMDTLPIIPDAWRYHVKKSGAKQFKVIRGLMAKASTVYIATDHDREGEAIARTLMDRCRFQGPVKRVCLRALDEKSIRKALSDIRPGDETVPLYYAALSRQRADWLIGMNITRLYTSLARQVGFRETLHVGRVQTPTVALVCQRDTEIAQFTPSPYYVLKVDVSVQNGAFQATWQVPQQFADDQGRCTNKAFAEQVAQQVTGSTAVIQTAETKDGKESAPLPFDLNALQQYASKRWGYTAQQVLDAAQKLYEHHKALTYPRTDCRYLPVSQRDDISDTLQGLIQSDPEISGLVAGADPHRKSRAYNDAKVTAHHAIIPTPAVTDISQMSEIEYRLYDAARRFYIAQFYAPFEFQRTHVEVVAGQHAFETLGKVPRKQGWKVIFGSDAESHPEDDGEHADDTQAQEQAALPKMHQGEPAMIEDSDVSDKMTRPPPHFTEASLLSAMEHVSRFVPEERFKQILKDTSGLGTSATRAGIIQGAVDRDYLVRRKKTLRASDKAFALVTIVPEAIKSPGTTAAWEQQLEMIANGDARMNTFMEQISGWVRQMVVTVKDNAAALTQQDSGLQDVFAAAKGTTYACATCGGELKRIKGKHGFFWGCQNAACRKTFPDQRGKPGERQDPQDSPTCPECGKPMRQRKGKAPGKQRATRFWGCSAYPDCTGRLPFKRKQAPRPKTQTDEG